MPALPTPWPILPATSDQTEDGQASQSTVAWRAGMSCDSDMATPRVWESDL